MTTKQEQRNSSTGIPGIASAGKTIYISKKEAVLIHEFMSQRIESDTEGHMAKNAKTLMVKLNRNFGLPLPIDPSELK